MRQRRIPVVGFCSVLLLLLIVLVTGPACKKEPAPVARSDIQNNVPPPSAPSGDEPPRVEGKIALRILYVGLPNTERQQDFVSFLSRNFQTVQTADLYAFKEEQAQGSDVILLDKDGIQWASRGGKPLSDIRVSNQYTRPTVTLGIPGAFWTDRMGLKTGYM